MSRSITGPTTRPRPVRARRRRTWTGSALVALGLLVGCGGESERRPSVVLISLDTLRADHVGTLGYERDTTPYLDRLAEESLVFERAFAPAAWTLLSHMTMLTGLYPNQHGVLGPNWALASENRLVAESLADLGYQTIALYFEGWIHARHGFDRGFDVFRAHADAQEAGVHLADALAGLDPERPFFLFLHLFDIHCGPLEQEPGPIYDCPPPYDEMFLTGASERIPELPEYRLWHRPGLLDERAKEGLVALYDGGIRYVDDTLAGWIEGWKRDGWLDNTLLILTSDHGEALGQRGATISDHGGPYQDGLHIPLLVRPPGGLAQGRRVLAPVSLADVVPTIERFVGLTPTGNLPGTSLLAPIPMERTIYAMGDSFECLVEWPRKLLRLVPSGTWVQVDLDEDPGELVPMELTAEEFDRTRARFVTEVGDAADFPAPLSALWEDEADLERLRKMGYGGEETD